MDSVLVGLIIVTQLVPTGLISTVSFGDRLSDADESIVCPDCGEMTSMTVPSLRTYLGSDTSQSGNVYEETPLTT